ncbi:response regulator [Dinghuibacter silviterrae]|uniref:LuxR family two component transcriptional regulator n=1 Tax=Dinghuibacter silviterrae TaxID=1539049 RepID=A0A4R8DT36_9BACT|nr:response regulator transcription factor [Dinghuibacter silviterrae]TDX01430.1 LuxR family two component transcriptional regulator [Dinghuibacter silviterrae]
MRILIADDHAIVRKGLVSVLKEEFPSAEVEEVGDAETLFKLSLKGEWDLVISDLSMPGRSGLEIIAEIKQHFPKIPTLILSVHPEELYGPRVMRAGASGYLNKDAAPTELKKAIHWILQGRKYVSTRLADKLADDITCNNTKFPHELLSDRELNVMVMLASGESTGRIAELLSISHSTATNYRTKILQKMQLQSNTDLTRYCLEHGIL